MSFAIWSPSLPPPSFQHDEDQSNKALQNWSAIYNLLNYPQAYQTTVIFTAIRFWKKWAEMGKVQSCFMCSPAKWQFACKPLLLLLSVIPSENPQSSLLTAMAQSSSNLRLVGLFFYEERYSGLCLKLAFLDSDNWFVTYASHPTYLLGFSHLGGGGKVVKGRFKHCLDSTG